MKGFLQEYGIIMVVVAVVLGMLAFGKSGFSKNIQEAIIGSTNHIAETGDNITKGLEVKTGDVLNIEGNEYIVIEKKSSEQCLIISKTYIGSSTFQIQYDSSTYLRPDGKYANIYEDSTIDKYLEKAWYNDLSSNLKNAIIVSTIKQNAYSNQKDPDSKQENGFNGQTYNVINRHVFLPSVDELKNLIDLNSPDKVNNFLNGSYMWTRDAYQGSKEGVEFFNYYLGCLLSVPARDTYGVRPAFVIDLSKVDYKTVGHTDYK